jgi:hypothetical protein
MSVLGPSPAPDLQPMPAPLTRAALAPGQSILPLTSQLGLGLGASSTPSNTYAFSPSCLIGTWSSARSNCPTLMPWLPDTNVATFSGGLVLARPGSAYSVSLSASQLAPQLERNSWTTVNGQTIALANPAPATSVFLTPGLRGQEYSVAATGVWSFERLGALSVTGRVGEALLRSPLTPQNDFDRSQAVLALALNRGAFSGGVVGRVVSDSQPGYPSSNWGGIDVGMSWRTPWRGELSFGARNLVTAGDEPLPLLPDPSAAQRDDRRERTPYIEYRQDF